MVIVLLRTKTTLSHFKLQSKTLFPMPLVSTEISMMSGVSIMRIQQAIDTVNYLTEEIYMANNFKENLQKFFVNIQQILLQKNFLQLLIKKETKG